MHTLLLQVQAFELNEHLNIACRGCAPSRSAYLKISLLWDCVCNTEKLACTVAMGGSLEVSIARILPCVNGS